jgi:hypothetical protein
LRLLRRVESLTQKPTSTEEADQPHSRTSSS